MSVAIITSLLHTMLFKASKDGDSSLVSNENFSEKFRLVVGPSSGISSQKPSLLVSPLKKNKNPKPKFFLIADSKTCLVFWGFEQLSSAIGWGATWLISQTKYLWHFCDFQIWFISRFAANVLIIKTSCKFTRNVWSY